MNLRYDEKPNYEYLRTLFLNLYKMKKYDSNSEYEWNNIIENTNTLIHDN